MNATRVLTLRVPALSFAAALFFGAAAGVRSQERRPALGGVLEGKWITVAGELAGKQLDAALVNKQVYEFHGDTLTVLADGTALGVARYTIDTSKKPKEMDIVVGSLGTNPSIFEVEGDRLRICMDKPGGKRPTDFKTAPGSEQKMFVFKRAEARNGSLQGRWRARSG